ncbi:protein of unknown function [Vibrio tapetis subsp. tapetis]|uniref:Uncharacterized protein n=1 Tax=Vibrio tapetis subsp. tapetis TaxID=1671868 RepID=A0A2N8ZMT2_9VIBR|nr:protein of unknown function [Vibrio tapetis subsp. tapetis]
MRAKVPLLNQSQTFQDLLDTSVDIQSFEEHRMIAFAIP